MFSIKLDSKSKRNLKALSNKELMMSHIHKGIKKGFQDMGKDNQRNARRLIFNPPKTGRLYKWRGGIHQASAPGENPANMTGTLARSVNFKAREIELEFGYQAYYGKFLEKGTKKMEPRPLLQEIASRASAVGVNYFEWRIKKNLNSIFR